MFRIGILGLDNSHAPAFVKLCNIPDSSGIYWYNDVRITAIYGKDDLHEHTAEVAKEGKIEFLAEKPEDFFGNVLGDAMNFLWDFGNIYEGLYFYGSHLI